MIERLGEGDGVLVDPDPDGARLLLDAIVAGWIGLGEDPAQAEPLEPGQFTDQALLRELRLTQARMARTQGRWLELLAEAEQREVTLSQTALPTTTWLTEQNTHSAQSAREQVHLATGLQRWPAVAGALANGGLSVEQATAIVRGLDRLPDDLDPARCHDVATQLVEYAGSFGPSALARLVNRAVEVVAPEVAEEADRRAVERIDAELRRQRHLSWRRGPDGEVLLKAKLDQVTGEHLIAILRAIATQQRKTSLLAGIDVSRTQANADALGTVFAHYASCGQAPRHGADRPRLLVTVDFDTLARRLGTATLANTGAKLTAAQARRLACDAHILPVVLDGRSVPLDVGRARRLFTGHLGALLIARDRGCAFPGCDRPPADCEAHHRRPWWASGRTSLHNGVLLCTYHHHIVEPDPNAHPDTQWVIRLDHHGNPEFGAPSGRGAPPGQRRWRQHHRYQTPN